MGAGILTDTVKLLHLEDQKLIDPDADMKNG